MRGKHGIDGIEVAIAELYGGIRQQIIYFAAETGIGAAWVATRISNLLSPQGQGIQYQLSAVREETTGIHRSMEPLALAVNAHSSRTPVAIEAKRKTSNNAARKIGTQGGWHNKDGSPMTPEQRRKESIKRMKKRTDHVAKKILGGGTITPRAKLVKQKFYQARYAAKKAGLPLPPLPSEQKVS